MVILERKPDAWTDRRLAEACTQAAAQPSAFGAQAAAWRAASMSFMEAARHSDQGNGERATELRSSAFKVLHDAGLRVEQAVTGNHLAAHMSTGEPSPAQHRAAQLTECTARMIYLRGRGEASEPAFAEGAAVYYGAACAYERAIREWSAGQAARAMTWQQAAEQTLANHLVTAPWHGAAPRPETTT